MPQSLARIYLHIVFSTKHREAVIPRSICRKMEAYLAGHLESLKCFSIVNGIMPDHLHALCCLSRSLKIEDLIKEMKRSTGNWLRNHSSSEFREFKWQGGYAAFSVSASGLSALRRYVEGQEDHHKIETFEDELRRLFDEYDVEYDERYVWD